MRISQDQADHIHSLGDALREHLLFQQVREDNDEALLERLSDLGCFSPEEPGQVSPALLDLLTSVALSENSRRCLALLVSRAPRDVLLGANLNRVVEKGNVPALQTIRELCPLDDETMLRCVERAAFMGQEGVLASLLDGYRLPDYFLSPYRDAILRRHLPCLRVLVETQSNPIANQQALLESCARAQQDMIAFLEPHGDIVQVLNTLLQIKRDASEMELQFTDSLCEEFVPDAKLSLIADGVMAQPSPQDSLPRTYARLTRLELLSGTPSTPRSTPGNRL